MSAIMISTIKVTDPDGFQTYMQKTQAVAAPNGAKLLFRGKRGQMLNGDQPDGELVVVASFPDIATIQRWHQSEEYQALIPLRDASSEQVMSAYGELTPS